MRTAMTIVLNGGAVLLWVYSLFADGGRTMLVYYIQSSIVLFQIVLALSFESERNMIFTEGWGRTFRPDTPAKALILSAIFGIYLLQSTMLLLAGQSSPPTVMGGGTLAMYVLFLILLFRRILRGSKDDRSSQRPARGE
jgi:hypothetical protein